VTTRQALPADLARVVEQARVRAAESGELRPVRRGFAERQVPRELADFVVGVLTDGTYARAAAAIGDDDPDLASI